MSMFQGLNTALSALYASQQGLATTGNNVANANTAGYSRQRVDLAGTGGSTTPAYFSKSSAVGTGVSVTDIARLRDQFLETQGLQAHSAAGNYTVASTNLSTMETALGEPGDNGLQSQLSTFWSSWDDVANNPGDSAARTEVTENAQTLVTTFQSASSTFQQVSATATSKLKGDVASINAMATNIAKLNSSIQAATNSGQTPNALLDQRDLLVSQLSDLVGITVQPTTAGSVSVSIGGVPLVRDATTKALQVDDTGNPVVLRWDSDNNAATVTDGQIASVTGGDVQGQMDTINTTVPKYLTLLNNVAASVISAVNTQQASGYDLNGNPGSPMFDGTDASTISLDPAMAGDTSLIAASSSATGTLDNKNALAMANLGSAANSPDKLYQQMIDVLGVESQRSQGQSTTQNSVVASVDAQRQSVSGVNLDEEMTNMIEYQKAYNASAKYMSVLDQSLDALISMVG